MARTSPTNDGTSRPRPTSLDGEVVSAHAAPDSTSASIDIEIDLDTVHPVPSNDSVQLPGGLGVLDVQSQLLSQFVPGTGRIHRFYERRLQSRPIFSS